MPCLEEGHTTKILYVWCSIMGANVTLGGGGPFLGPADQAPTHQPTLEKRKENEIHSMRRPCDPPMHTWPHEPLNLNQSLVHARALGVLATACTQGRNVTGSELSTVVRAEGKRRLAGSFLLGVAQGWQLVLYTLCTCHIIVSTLHGKLHTGHTVHSVHCTVPCLSPKLFE